MTTIDLPELAEDILVQDQEAFLSAVSDAKEGRLDTIPFHDIEADDIPDDGVEAVITRCVCVGKKSSKEKEKAAYPSLILQIKVPSTDDVMSFTTTNFYSTKGTATTFIMSMFTRLLGADLELIESPNGDDYSFQSKIDYYDTLGAKIVGLSVRVKITSKESDAGIFNRMDLSRSD